jgi:hypothetical protein
MLKYSPQASDVLQMGLLGSQWAAVLILKYSACTQFSLLYSVSRSYIGATVLRTVYSLFWSTARSKPPSWASSVRSWGGGGRGVAISQHWEIAGMGSSPRVENWKWRLLHREYHFTLLALKDVPGKCAICVSLLHRLKSFI